LEKADAKSSENVLILTLIIALFSVSLSGPILSVVSLDIAQTFLGNTNPTSVNATAQINTINRIAEAVFALIMGFLTVKFRSRQLLLVGTLFILISALGSYFAPTLSLFQSFFILEGGGTVIIAITAFSLVGELTLTKDKPKVVSYIHSVGNFAFLVATPAIGIITNILGWRSNFIWLVLPLAVSGLLLSFFGIPSKKSDRKITKTNIMLGYKEVFKNKSAVACLTAGMCGSAGSLSILAVAFFRKHFLSNLSVADQVSFSSGIVMLAAALFVVATLATGRLFYRVGGITLTVIGAVGNTIFAFLFFLMPNLWAAAAVYMLQIWFFGMAGTAWNCLALDQIPTYRGTMMSLRAIFLAVGVALTTTIGGLVLGFSGSYQAMGLAVALTILPSIPLTYFLTKNPYIIDRKKENLSRA